MRESMPEASDALSQLQSSSNSKTHHVAELVENTGAQQQRDNDDCLGRVSLDERAGQSGAKAVQEKTTMHSASVTAPTHSSVHPPSIKWSQDKANVYLTVVRGFNVVDSTTATSLHPSLGIAQPSCVFQSSTFSAVGSNNGQKTITADTLSITVGPEAVALSLYDLIVVESSRVKVLGDAEGLAVTLRKETPSTWPRLTKGSEKLHYISLDWSKWTEDEDECSVQHGSTPELEGTPVTLPDGRLVHVPPLTPFGDHGGAVMEIKTEDCRLIPDAEVPLLSSFITDDAAVKSTAINFWNHTLTAAQRLHTLTDIWNAVPMEERGALLRTLVELMLPLDPTIADHIKGGDEVLRDLASSEYSGRYVTSVKSWVESIKSSCTSSERLRVLVELFKCTSEYEQKIICSTFL